MTPDDERALFNAAAALAEREAGRDGDGEGVAAAALADDGTMLTGVWVDAMCDSAWVADNSELGFRFLPLSVLRPSPWWDAIETEPPDGA